MSVCVCVCVCVCVHTCGFILHEVEKINIKHLEILIFDANRPFLLENDLVVSQNVAVYNNNNSFG